MGELHFSEDDGKTFKPLKSLSEAPEIRTGGIVDDSIIPYIGEISGIVSFKVKKRHMSRKYKKKHGLLKKQRKRFLKALTKTINKFVKVTNKLVLSIDGLRCVPERVKELNLNYIKENENEM